MTGEEAGPKKKQGARNPGASIQQKLRNRAKATGEGAALLLIRYINERFLYRLSVSPYRDRFILRGATLFSIWTDGPHRATRDVDLLARRDNSSDAMRQILREVCEQEASTDGVAFLFETLNVEERTVERIYPGLHIEMLAALGTARPRLEIDVAFGEAALPPPQEETVSALLDMPAPRLLAYRKETAIAEKCQAMVHLAELNTRMKDFYDLWYLCRTFPFDGATLCEALHATFTRRGEAFPEGGLPLALTDEFARSPEKARQWASFVGKAALSEDELTFAEVVGNIRAFLQPPLAALADAAAFPLSWSKEAQEWTKVGHHEETPRTTDSSRHN